MICSHNELVAALQKALTAAGAPTGIAEDVASAGAWIAAQGGDGIGAVLAGLESPLPRICEYQIDGDKVLFHAARIALAGPSALDFLHAGVCREALLYHVDSPVLLVGLAARYRADNGMGFVVTDEVPGSLAYAVNTLDTQQSSSKTSLRIAAVDGPAPSSPASTKIEVEPQAWEQLTRLAAAMYVPSSEQSRTAGAGAGLLDND